METETQFAEGIYFSKPKEGTPEFIKGRISVKVADFIAFAQKHEKKNGYIDIDLMKSKKGTLYLKLNTWQPEKKESEDIVEASDPF